MPRRLQVGAEIRGPPVLPDDGVVNGFPRIFLPDNDRFPLVRDPDRRDLLWPHSRTLDGFPAGPRRRSPEIRRIMLHPARGREMLREFLLRHGCDLHRPVKKDRPARRRALIDR